MRRQRITNKEYTVRITRLSLVAMVLCSVVGPCFAAAPNAADSGTTTGQRIGNLISAVISTAFPAVDKVITAIWPPGKSADKKNADQATPAVKNAKDVADAAQKENLAKLTAAANNLAVARTFATIAGDASVRIAVMQALLGEKDYGKGLPTADKQNLQDWWKPAADELRDLQAQKLKDQVDSLDDDFLKNTFSRLQGVSRSLVDNITDQLSQGRVAALTKSLGQLEPKLAEIVPLTAILIGDIGSSVTKASTKITGAAGPGDAAAAAAAEADRSKNLAIMGKLEKYVQAH